MSAAKVAFEMKTVKGVSKIDFTSTPNEKIRTKNDQPE